MKFKEHVIVSAVFAATCCASAGVLLNPFVVEPAGGGGGGTPAITYQGLVDSTDNLTTYTFSAVPIGAAASRDHVVVGLTFRATSNGRTFSSVTIGGVSATLILKNDNTDDAGNSTGSALYSAAVPTGTTADVVMTLSGGASRASCDAWTVENVTSFTPYDTATYHTASSASTFNLDLDSPTGTSVAMGVALLRVGGGVWTGLTENSDRDIESAVSVVAATGTFTSAATPNTITVDPDSGTPSFSNAVAVTLQ